MQAAGTASLEPAPAPAHGNCERNAPSRARSFRQQLSWGQGECALTFEDVTFTVRMGGGGKEKVILAPVSGHFEPGTMVALMGPSGCGKTTLLDILAAKKTSPYGGTVHFNGRPRDHLFHRITSYVPQEDIMSPHMTVKEVVIFHTRLKMDTPLGISYAKIVDAAMLRLEAVGLREVADSRIGNAVVAGISGGQRRRVSLACGLASGAQLFFCDEPTSGLSAADAEACVQFMQCLAREHGVTMICAIHQPRVEVAQLFDHLLLLTAHPGRVVYNGPMDSAEEHWESVGFPVPEFTNPTDFFLDTVTPGTRLAVEDQLSADYDVHLKPGIEKKVALEMHHERHTVLEVLERRREHMLKFGSVPTARNTVYGVRFGMQLRLVFARHLRLSLRDRQGILTDLIAAVAKGVVVGIAYVGIGSKHPRHQISFLFMVLMTVSVDGLKGMAKLIEERTIMKMETSEALYRESAYVISFTILNSIVGLLSNTVFLVIVFAMSGFCWCFFGSFWIWMTLLFFTMDSLYLMVAAIAKDSASALILVLPLFMLCLLYNGMTVSRDTVPSFMTWGLQISPVAKTMEALTVDVATMDEGPEWAAMVAALHYRPEQGLAVMVMGSTFMVFRIVQVMSLRMLNNIKR